MSIFIVGWWYSQIYQVPQIWTYRHWKCLDSQNLVPQLFGLASSPDETSIVSPSLVLDVSLSVLYFPPLDFLFFFATRNSCYLGEPVKMCVLGKKWIHLRGTNDLKRTFRDIMQKKSGVQSWIPSQLSRTVIFLPTPRGWGVGGVDLTRLYTSVFCNS